MLNDFLSLWKPGRLADRRKITAFEIGVLFLAR